MDVKRYCEKLISKVYTDTRMGVTDAEKYDIHAWLADYFTTKASEIEPVALSSSPTEPLKLTEDDVAIAESYGRVSNPDE